MIMCSFFQSADGSIGTRKFIVISLILCLVVLASAAFADEIVTVNHQRISGKITEETDQSVKIQTTTGELAIPRTRIQTVKREEVGQTEALGDLAVDRKNYYEALEMYQKAHTDAPESAELSRKIQMARGRILQQENEKYAALFQKAAQLSGQGDRQGARQALHTVLEQAPKEGPSSKKACLAIAFQYYHDALAAEDRVQYSVAIESLKKATEECPDAVMPHLLMARFLHRFANEPTSALEHYAKGIELGRKYLTLDAEERQDYDSVIPKEAWIDANVLNDFRYEKAELEFTMGEKQKAADEFLVLFQEDPKRYAKATKYIVDIYTDATSKLDSTKLLDQLDVALKLDKTSARAWFLKGRIYYDQGEWDKAAEALNNAVENDPMLPEAHLFRARTCLRKGEPVLARKDLEAEVKVVETYSARHELGEVMLLGAEYDKALEQFNRAIQIDAEKYPAYLGRARCNRLKAMAAGVSTTKKEELLNLAGEDIKFVLNKNGKSREARIEGGRLLKDQKKYSDAKDLLKGVIDDLREEMLKQGAGFKQDDRQILVEAYIECGDASLLNNEGNQAQADFEEALGVDPSSALAYNKLGETYQQMSELPKAKENFEKALVMNPGNPEFELSFGIFYQKYMRDYGPALLHYEAFLKKGGVDSRVEQWIRECKNAIDGQNVEPASAVKSANAAE